MFKTPAFKISVLFCFSIANCLQVNGSENTKADEENKINLAIYTEEDLNYLKDELLSLKADYQEVHDLSVSLLRVSLKKYQDAWKRICIDSISFFRSPTKDFIKKSYLKEIDEIKKELEYGKIFKKEDTLKDVIKYFIENQCNFLLMNYPYHSSKTTTNSVEQLAFNALIELSLEEGIKSLSKNYPDELERIHNEIFTVGLKRYLSDLKQKETQKIEEASNIKKANEEIPVPPLFFPSILKSTINKKFNFSKKSSSTISENINFLKKAEELIVSKAKKILTKSSLPQSILDQLKNKEFSLKKIKIEEQKKVKETSTPLNTLQLILNSKRKLISNESDEEVSDDEKLD